MTFIVLVIRQQCFGSRLGIDKVKEYVALSDFMDGLNFKCCTISKYFKKIESPEIDLINLIAKET